MFPFPHSIHLPNLPLTWWRFGRISSSRIQALPVTLWPYHLPVQTKRFKLQCFIVHIFFSSCLDRITIRTRRNTVKCPTCPHQAVVASVRPALATKQKQTSPYVGSGTCVRLDGSRTTKKSVFVVTSLNFYEEIKQLNVIPRSKVLGIHTSDTNTPMLYSGRRCHQ